MAEPNRPGSTVGKQGAGSTSSEGGARNEPSSRDRAKPSGGITGRLKERAATQLNVAKNTATESLHDVAGAVRESTKQLRDKQHGAVAGYVEQAADGIDRLSQQLKDKDAGALLQEGQRFARERPAIFIGSAFALGLVGSRFLKSSASRSAEDHRELEEPGRGHEGERGSAAPGSLPTTQPANARHNSGSGDDR